MADHPCADDVWNGDSDIVCHDSVQLNDYNNYSYNYWSQRSNNNNLNWKRADSLLRALKYLESAIQNISHTVCVLDDVSDVTISFDHDILFSLGFLIVVADPDGSGATNKVLRFEESTKILNTLNYDIAEFDKYPLSMLCDFKVPPAEPTTFSFSNNKYDGGLYQHPVDEATLDIGGCCASAQPINTSVMWDASLNKLVMVADLDGLPFEL